MNYKATLLAISLWQCSLLFSQVKSADPDTSIFSRWANILRAKKELTYIGIGPWVVNGKGEVPVLLEDQIRQDFLLFSGRSNQIPFIRSLIFNFDLGLNMRMYQGLENPSYPIRPMNFMPAFSLYYLLNQFKFSIPDLAFLYNNDLKDFYTLKITLSHFSNGQSGNFYNYDSSNSNRRDGNFSTNFLKSEFSWSRFLNDHLLSASLDYQRDFGIGNLLGFAEGLEKSYGKNRIGTSLIFHSKNLKSGYYRYKKVDFQNSDSIAENKRALILKSRQHYKRYTSIKIRYDTEYILGDLSNYPTQKKPSFVKNRFSQKFTLSIYPANGRTPGFFFLLYYGRDYYNICYTDKILNFKTGLLFELNKYVPPNTVYIPSR